MARRMTGYFPARSASSEAKFWKERSIPRASAYEVKSVVTAVRSQGRKHILCGMEVRLPFLQTSLHERCFYVNFDRSFD